MARTRLLNMGMLAIMLISIMAAGCSNDLPHNSANAVPSNNSANTVPSDIRNTKWVGQGTRSNITLDVGTNGINISGTGTPWDGWCGYGGAGYGGYGCCAFRTYNGQVFTWQYTRQGDTLTVRNCSNPDLDGQWTRLQ